MKHEPPPIHYLRWFSIFLFGLSLAGMFYAGLAYNELRALDPAPLTEAGDGEGRDNPLPEEVRFTLALAISLVVAILAAMVYVGAVLTERLLHGR